MRGDRIVIPQSLRQDLKIKVHADHQDVNSCFRRARDLIFWPGMSADIRAYVESCDTCATYCAKQPEQPLQMHEDRERPWQKVGSDIFTIEGRNYVVTVDYYCQFIELDYLPETNSATVITKLSHRFARHGIPDAVVSENGPQYASSEFQCFARHWNFQHKRIAPGNSPANGQAESAVKIIKSAKSGKDPHIALLNLRNTPNEGMSSSPVQRLMGRRTQSVLPATPAVLKPSKIPVSEHSRLQCTSETAHVVTYLPFSQLITSAWSQSMVRRSGDQHR